MAAQIPPIQAHSTVEVEDSCNDCSPCCWGRKFTDVDDMPREKREQILDQIKDSQHVYNFTVNVQESPRPSPLKRDEKKVQDFQDIIKGIQEKK